MLPLGILLLCPLVSATGNIHLKLSTLLTEYQTSKEFQVRNAFQCANLCKRDLRCKTVNYDHTTRACSFLTLDLDSINDNGNFHEFIKTRNKPDENEACSRHDCSHGSLCAHVADIYLCLKMPDCGTPEDILDGDIVPNTTAFGAMSYVVCNTGYNFSGIKASASCTWTGLWEKVSGSCNVVDCGSPGGIRNGSIVFNTTTFGSVAHVVCKNGYNFTGDKNSVSCTSQGMWETVAGTCEVVDCGVPEPPSSGAIMVYNNTIFESKVYVHCVNLTSFYGNSTIGECTTTGRWTGVHGLCKLDVVGIADWILVFRATADINLSVYTSWTDDSVYHDHPVDPVAVQPGCMTLNTSLPCDIHFKSKLVTTWETANIQKVKLVLLKNNEVRKKIVFDGAETDKTNWFSETQVIRSSWTDLTSSTFNYFSIKGLQTRRFYINHSFMTCSLDVGWMLVIDGNDGSLPCYWDNPASFPRFVYHMGQSKAVFSNYEYGDVMAIMVKTE